MSIVDLIAVCHHRWSVPVLAELDRTHGARFVLLANRLGVGRASLRRTLAALIELGLVRRDPGYGHPLRPEYLLTPAGERAAVLCTRLLEAVDGKAGVLQRKWSLPVLAALGREARFSELRAALPGITARALAMALKELERAGLVERRVEATYPPSTIYAATREAWKLQRILA